MPKLKNSNETFWVIFKHCESKKPRFRFDFVTIFFFFGKVSEDSPIGNFLLEEKVNSRLSFGINAIMVMAFSDMIWPTPVQGHLQ